MLQQRVKYMRIIPITNSTIFKKYNNQDSAHEKNHKAANSLHVLQGVPSSYFINFKGYKEDEEFLTHAAVMLDNMLKTVDLNTRSRFEPGADCDFLASLEYIKSDEILYSKILSSPEIFAKLESGFEYFDRTVLQSLLDVKYSNKHFTKYWDENSKIDTKKISDIIRSSLNSPDENINKIIKKSDDETFEKIKTEVIKNWYLYAYETLKNDRTDTVEHSLELLSEIAGKEYAIPFFTKERIKLRDDFNKNTVGKIFSEKLSQDRKLDGFKLLLSYIENKLYDDRGSELERDFELILEAQKKLEYAKEKESLFYAKDAIQKLHKLAFEKWEKDNLNEALNIKLKKQIFIKTEEKKNKNLHYCQNYSNFDTDNQYFTARYFNTRYKKDGIYDYDDNDYLWQIVNDRHNIKPAKQAVKEMSLAFKENRETYFETLDKFYDILQERQFDSQINIPERDVENPDDRLSFVDLYIDKLGKTEEFKRRSESEKLDYLTKLTRDEMTLLSDDLKKDWLRETEPYALVEEVNRQARNTSVFLGMYDELKKVNINLDEIKIKTADFSVSLKDALINRAVITNSIQEDTVGRLSSQIAELQRVFNNTLNEKEKKAVDKNIAEGVPKFVDIIAKTGNNKELNEELKKLSTAVKNSNEPTKTLLGSVQGILLSRGIYDGYNTSKDYIKHAKKVFDELRTTPIASGVIKDSGADSIFPDFTSMLPDMSPVDAIHNAAFGLALSGGASHAGLWSSIGTALGGAAAVPVAVCALVAAAGGGAIYAAYRAGKLEENQRDIIFSIEI